jgi:DNA repair protein RadA/Sms
MGKCPDCGTWDSLEEELLDPAARDPQRALVSAWQELSEGGANAAPAAGARALAQIDAAAPNWERLSTGIREFDRTLGASRDARASSPMTLVRAGLVPGSAVLVGGEPGIGKSTLLIQAAAGLAGRGLRTLYVSSEESAEQVAARARRVRTEVDEAGGDDGRDAPPGDDALFLLHDTNLARIVEQARKIQPRAVVIDSIQMIYRGDVSAAPGSVTQLRRCCAELVYLAKSAGFAVVLVGHVTKDGQLAGPRLLEHMVDTVLSFEGDRAHAYRVVRAVKNRFGSTLEIGLFEMTGSGLREVDDGAGVASLDRREPPPGCVPTPIISGTRCLMVEIQALTATGFLGAAKRKSSGLDANRMAMLIAVLEQHAGLRLADRDIFASSVGGVRVLDPSSDLALLLAIGGAHYKRAIGARTCALGEVALSGEVHAVPHLEQRVREAARLGCTRIVLPQAGARAALPKLPGVELCPVRNVDGAMEVLG